MAAFASLSEKLNHIFSKMTKRGRLTELEIKQAMREVRIALLEADVNINVVKQFTAAVSEKAVGQEDHAVRQTGAVAQKTGKKAPARRVRRISPRRDQSAARRRGKSGLRGI